MKTTFNRLVQRALLFACLLFLSVFCLPAGTVFALDQQPVSCLAVLDGQRIHYLDYGSGAEAVLFIHGWNCDARFWRFQAPVAEKAARLIMIDLPGHGLSDKPETAYTQELFARSVDAVVRDAGLEKVILVGHSMGASVARHYLRNFKNPATAFVCVDGAFPDPLPGIPADEWEKQMTAFAGLFQGPGYRDFTKGFVASMLGPDINPDLRDEILVRMLAAPQHVGADSMKNFVDPVNWAGPPVQTRTLAVYAASPQLPPDYGTELKKVFPNLDYRVWDGVGHFLMMEQPEKFNQALIEFIRGE